MALKDKKKKDLKKVEKVKKVEEEGGTSLDDAFGDDGGVEYAESKPKKEKKKRGIDEDELEEEIDEVEEQTSGEEKKEIAIKASKPIAKVKKGDKIKIDGNECEVDAHYVLIDHGTTQEMAIEVFDKSDKDYQIRYFSDQVESTIEVYELREILYVRKSVGLIEW